MEKWMTTEDIINENLLSKINIIANVKNGKLTAYDYHSGKPVNLDAMAQQFKEIVEMSSKKIMGTKWVNVEAENEYGEIKFNYTPRKSEIEPFKILPDEWTDKNGTHRTPIVPWKILHRRLSQKIQTQISLSQYDTILKGWGSKQVEEIVLSSIFLESDVSKLTTREPQEEKSNATPQQTKSQNGLLKLIGALINIYYIEKQEPPKGSPRKTDGTANVSFIAEQIQNQIRNLKPEATLDGLEERSLRDKIKAALEEFEKNRT